MSAAKPAGGSLVALTGATGFLGSHIADRLLMSGYRVRASVRASSDLRWIRGKPLETMEVPLTPPPGTAAGAAPEVADAAPPDPALVRFVSGATAVIHCAGVVRAPDRASYRRGNVTTTRRLLAAAVTEASCRVFVLVSSLAAAGPAPPQAPRCEDDPCHPITDYGRSKLAAEKLLEDAALPFRTAVLRPPALYGPRDRAFLPLFRLAQRGWSLRLSGGPAALSLLDGRDAAGAVLALLETAAACGAYFVDDGRAYDLADLAAALALAFRRRNRPLPVPLSWLRGAAWLLGRRAERLPLLHPDRLADLTVPGWVCSSARLRRDTGFRPQYDLRSGIAETLVFYRQNDWLPAT
jgi:nucleoside-diphosphate-sugar epimerase